MNIDGKYISLVVNPCSGNHHSHKDGVFFCVHDAALPGMLRTYLAECLRLNADEGQILGATKLIERVDAWQAHYPEKVKTPDVSSDCELEHVVNPVD